MNRSNRKPDQRRVPPFRDIDIFEFERLSGFAGERAYPTGWRPAWESGFSIDEKSSGASRSGGRFGGPRAVRGPTLEDRSSDAHGTWRPASSGPSGGVSGYRGQGPKCYRRADARILEDVCDRLTDAEDVDATHLECTVENGEVALGGSVRTPAERRRAVEIAESVSGVLAVRGLIRVEKSDAAKEVGGGEP
jgi:BON domain-containing protein